MSDTALIWDYSGIEYAASALAVLHGYGTQESWADQIRRYAERAYGSSAEVGYVETAGFCVTVWADDNHQRHAKVTLSGYGVARHLAARVLK